MGFLETLGDIFRRRTPLDGEAPAWLKQLKLEKARELGAGSLRRPKPAPFDTLIIDPLETGQQVDTGKVGLAAQYWQGCFRDTTFGGLISTRSSGLVSLPKKFSGSQAAVDFLQSGYGGNEDDPQSGFDVICPLQELAALEQDGIGLGAAVAQLVECEGLDIPILARLDPSGLEYKTYDNCWVYNTDQGPVAITPGQDGWVLFTPGGRIAPWRHGSWLACAKATMRKEHALLSLDEYLYRFGLPARHGTYPEGAGRADREAFQAVLEDWSNTALSSPKDYAVQLLQLNAEGAKVFIDLVNSCNDEIIISICGQHVTVDGGSNFQDSSIHKSIRQDLIKTDAQALADCINSQVIPQALAMKFGANVEQAFVSWAVEPPKDIAATAQSLIASAQAIEQLTGQKLGEHVPIDIRRLAADLQIPLLQPTAAAPMLKVVK